MLEDGGADIYVIYVYGDDDAPCEAVAKGADRYGTRATKETGDGEFLGTEKQDGSDREQRDDARKSYTRIIEEAGDRRYHEAWSRIHSAYGEALGKKVKGNDAAPPRNGRMLGTFLSAMSGAAEKNLSESSGWEGYDGSSFIDQRGYTSGIAGRREVVLHGRAQENGWGSPDAASFIDRRGYSAGRAGVGEIVPHVDLPETSWEGADKMRYDEATQTVERAYPRMCGGTQFNIESCAAVSDTDPALAWGQMNLGASIQSIESNPPRFVEGFWRCPP